MEDSSRLVLMDGAARSVIMARKQEKADERIAARLEMIVNYETVQDRGDIEEIIEKAREHGHVVKATYKVLRTYTEELV